MLAPDDSDMGVSVLQDRGFIFFGGIIHYYHLQFVIEGDALNQCTGVIQPVIIDSYYRQFNVQYLILTIILLMPVSFPILIVSFLLLRLRACFHIQSIQVLNRGVDKQW